MVHLFYLQDDETGSLSTIMFETRDRQIIARFDQWSDLQVSTVIEIRPDDPHR